MEVSRQDPSKRINHISAITGVQPQNVIHITIRPTHNLRHSDSRSINSQKKKNNNGTDKDKRIHITHSSVKSTDCQKSNYSSDLRTPDNRSDIIMRKTWSDKNGCVNESHRNRNIKQIRSCFARLDCGCSRLYIALSLFAALLVGIAISAALVATLFNNKTTTTTTISTDTVPTTEIETTEGPTTELITKSMGMVTNTTETVYGIWNTTAGGDSTPATVGMGVGNYYPGEIPNNAFDNQTNTKYTNFGICALASSGSLPCGVSTGLYLTPQGGPSLLLYLQFCTGNDLPDRDPFTITIEGSNQPSSLLTLGSSWTLIYNGSTGLQPITNRYTCGAVQSIANNSIWYSSYRLLVTSKRGPDVATQYSEVILVGYR